MNKTINNSVRLNIQTSDDLKAHITRLKAGIAMQEIELKDRWKKLPSESLKAGVTTIIPAAIASRLPSKTWTIVRQGAALIKGFKKISQKNKPTFKDRLVNSARDLGLKTAFRIGYAFWKKNPKA